MNENQKAPECVIVCQQSVDCGAWPDNACEKACGQAARNQTIDADVAGVAAALEQQRALRIVEAVAAVGARFTGKAFASGYSLACEEIAERLRTEQWTLGDTETPLPAAQAGDELPPFEDHRVQAVYRVLSEAPQLWDHFTARRVVAALAEGQPAPEPTTPEWFAHG